MKTPKEFSDLSDSPTNNGHIGQDKDWDEIRSPYLFDGDEPFEIDEDDLDFFPDQNFL
jgi:hypothetical protein